MKKPPQILMYMENYYSVALHEGVAQYAMEAGWSLNATMYRKIDLPKRNWSGVVGTFEVGGKDDFLLQEILPKKIPAVSLTVSKFLPSVLPDNEAIGKMAAEHLLELGYKNYAFYFWQSKFHETMRANALEGRLNPKFHTFRKINFTKRPRIRRQGLSARLRILRRFLQKTPKPVAIVAPLDDLAVEVIELCEDMGLKIPGDVGVLGVNNDRLICDFTPVPLSSIDDNEYKIGYEGASLLYRLMQAKRVPKAPILIQPKGVEVRKSTDLLNISEVPDRYVAGAVRLIADQFHKNIKVHQIAKATGISQRSLQDRFMRHLGRSIHDQIISKRIDHAKRQLRETDYKTSHIAVESGFSSREVFSKSFKKATGMSPKQYRELQSS